MSSATLAWSTAWILLSALASMRLWRLTSFPEQFAKNGYRWLAVAVLCLGVGGTVQQAFGGLIGGPSPLRFADLISLAALPALVIGLVTITADRSEQGRAAPSWPPTRGMLVDGSLFAVSLFAIGLVTMFGPDYVAAGTGFGGFALDLIRPVADLAALGLVLPLIPRSPRLTTLPVLALAALTVADSLAVAQRAAGTDPGVGSHLALAAALCFVAAIPGPNSGRDSAAGASPQSQAGQAHEVGQPGSGSWRLAIAWLAGARMAGPAAALAAAVVVAALAVFSHPATMQAVAVTGAIVVVLLVIRLAWFTTRAVTVTASEQASERAFHSLAASTSDTVLICDAGGLIEYVSPAIAEFGYGRDELAGTGLVDIVHPDDRSAGLLAAVTALEGVSGTATFTGRVRAADGSWRQVSATLSRYGQTAEQPRLLVACHDESELAALRRELTQLTFHDGLTGLPNRTYLEDLVKSLSPSGDQPSGDQGGGVAAILVSLDEDPLTADLGSQPGESLVFAQAGRRLRAVAPPGAIVARWGGDQFAILIGETGSGDQGVADPAQVTDLAEHLAGAIADEPFSVAAKDIRMTASVGVAMAGAADSDQVLGHAHTAMMKAIQAGGGRIEVFSPQMHAAASRRVELAAALAEAIAEHRLRIEYQPVVELATGRVTYVEALVSPMLTSPKLTSGQQIGAEDLLSLAEEAGLSLRFGDWLLREACGHVAQWRNRDARAAGGPGIGLAVSFSARQVAAPGFAASVLTALDAAGLPPQAFTLQVTERTLIEFTGPVAAELAGLRAEGVKLAVGDFGPGYASLSYLRQLAVDAIKIDRSVTAGFGADPTLTLVMSAVVGLGRDLGVEMIAAGIDRPDQVELVMNMGCALGQGTWLGRPLPASAIDPLAAGSSGSWQQGPELAGDRSQDQAGDPACSPAS